MKILINFIIFVVRKIMPMTQEEIENRLKQFTVGIAGAGGLGSNCAAALTRVGIGKLIIADFDVVSKSNLNRQFYFANQIGMKKVIALKENLLQIDSQTIIEIHDIKIDAINLVDIFGHVDVLVEAFDLALMKQMLAETVIQQMPDVPVVFGIGMAGIGKNNEIKMEQRGQFFLCGDQITEISDHLPPLAPRVGIVANMQANTVLEILLCK